MLALSLANGQAQGDNSDPVVAYNNAISHIQLEKWDEGLKSVNTVLTERGEGAMERYGPVFGHFHFLKGILNIYD